MVYLIEPSYAGRMNSVSPTLESGLPQSYVYPSCVQGYGGDGGVSAFIAFEPSREIPDNLRPRRQDIQSRNLDW